MKRISGKRNSNKLFNNDIHKIRNSKKRKALFQIKLDMNNYFHKNNENNINSWK